MQAPICDVHLTVVQYVCGFWPLGPASAHFVLVMRLRMKILLLQASRICIATVFLGWPVTVPVSVCITRLDRIRFVLHARYHVVGDILQGFAMLDCQPCLGN